LFVDGDKKDGAKRLLGHPVAFSWDTVGSASAWRNYVWWRTRDQDKVSLDDMGKVCLSKGDQWLLKLGVPHKGMSREQYEQEWRAFKEDVIHAHGFSLPLDKKDADFVPDVNNPHFEAAACLFLRCMDMKFKFLRDHCMGWLARNASHPEHKRNECTYDVLLSRLC
jgi:hypothetical protein